MPALSSIQLEAMLLFAATCLGSAAVYIFGDRPEVPYLDRAFPSWKGGLSKEAIGFIVYMLVGGSFGVLIAEPATAKQAVFAGLGWPTLLGLARRKPHV